VELPKVLLVNQFGPNIKPKVALGRLERGLTWGLDLGNHSWNFKLGDFGLFWIGLVPNLTHEEPSFSIPTVTIGRTNPIVDFTNAVQNSDGHPLTENHEEAV